MVIKGYIFHRCPEHLAAQADQSDEVWRDALYDGQYIKGVRVSNMGTVRLRAGRCTTGFIHYDRHKVGIQIGTKTKQYFVYVIMAFTFLGPWLSPEHTVDHINGDYQDNLLTNLRWATREQQGRSCSSNRTIHKYDLEGRLFETYGSIAQAVQESGSTKDRIQSAARNGGKTTGFIWRYA
jgi:hypothetical protein